MESCYWEDDSVGNILVVTLSQIPRTHVKTLNIVVHTCNPNPGKAEAARALGVLAGWASTAQCKFQTVRTSVAKTRWITPRE